MTSSDFTLLSSKKREEWYNDRDPQSRALVDREVYTSRCEVFGMMVELCFRIDQPQKNFEAYVAEIAGNLKWIQKNREFIYSKILEQRSDPYFREVVIKDMTDLEFDAYLQPTLIIQHNIALLGDQLFTEILFNRHALGHIAFYASPDKGEFQVLLKPYHWD